MTLEGAHDNSKTLCQQQDQGIAIKKHPHTHPQLPRRQVAVERGNLNSSLASSPAPVPGADFTPEAGSYHLQDCRGGLLMWLDVMILNE